MLGLDNVEGAFQLRQQVVVVALLRACAKMPLLVPLAAAATATFPAVAAFLTASPATAAHVRWHALQPNTAVFAQLRNVRLVPA